MVLYMYKEIRVYFDDSTNIVDVAAKILDNTYGGNVIGGMRIAGEMRRTDQSPIQAGYTVRLNSVVGGIRAICENPKAEVIGKNEDEALRLVIEAIEKQLNVSTAMTRVEDKS